jgi:hypothetical protein
MDTTERKPSRAGDTKDPPLTEVYIYLGRIEPVLFFICLARKTQAPLAQIACDLYNLLIQETMIQKDDNLIVYAFEHSTARVETAQASHIDFKRADFPDSSLRQAFSRLMREPRPLGQPTFIVTATIEGKRPIKYTFTEIPLDAGFQADLPRIGGISPAAINDTPARGITLKPIPYLGVEGAPPLG